MKLITIKPTVVKRGNKVFTRNSFSKLSPIKPPKPLITTTKQF